MSSSLRKKISLRYFQILKVSLLWRPSGYFQDAWYISLQEIYGCSLISEAGLLFVRFYKRTVAL